MENNSKCIAGKQIITLVLKADTWEKTDDENIRKQIVKDVYLTDENAQVYFSSESMDELFKDIDEFWKDRYKQVASAMFNELVRRVVTWNGYIEAYIEYSENFVDSYSIDDKEFPEKMIDIPIVLIQDRNEMKIGANLEKEEKENK